jgi:hypothetical protein
MRVAIIPPENDQSFERLVRTLPQVIFGTEKREKERKDSLVDRTWIVFSIYK